CADCGKALLRLETEPGGVNVLVTGPGQVADKLDAQKQVALYKLLDELPEGSLQIQRGRRRAPRVPFYVAKGITRPSAAALVARLAVAVVRIRRPTVRRVAGGRARSDAERRLEDVLPRLVSRQDRRLVAHIVERLAQIRTVGQAVTMQPLADRAADAADALST